MGRGAGQRDYLELSKSVEYKDIFGNFEFEISTLVIMRLLLAQPFLLTGHLLVTGLETPLVLVRVRCDLTC